MNCLVEYQWKFTYNVGIRASFFGYFMEIAGIYIDRAENHKTLIMAEEYVNEPHDPA